MTRIRECKEEFYKKLHALECIKEDGWGQLIHNADEAPRIRYGLQNYDQDAPELLELRKMLGVDEKRPGGRRLDYVRKEKINIDKMKKHMLELGYSNAYISEGLDLHPTTFSNKLRFKKFTHEELMKIEDILQLKHGALMLRPSDYWAEVL